MNLKKLFLSLSWLLMLPALLTAKEARLMRFPGVSNDHIVFTYAGDLYTVPIEGGTARKITSQIGMEMFARYSPDGARIAFTGQYDGNTEVYIMPAEGGVPERITYTATLHRDDVSDRMGPNNIVMTWTPDGKDVVFRTRKKSFNSFKGSLYKVPVDGGMPEEMPFPEGGFSSFNKDGSKMAYNRVFREFRTWKYYRGGMADEIWIHDFNTHETKAITNNDAQDIIPMWIGDEIFFLSDRDRTMNLFVYNTQTEKTEKVTDFNDYDIKFPSHHGNTIVFEKGGYLFTFDAVTREIKQIPVTINNDMVYARQSIEDVSNNITSASLSPEGERILFSAHGELFSVPAEEGLTYNHTQTSGAHDRDGEYSPNGKWMAWLSDQSGEYEIWIKPADGEGKARQLTSGADTYKFNIRWSPDSRYIAWNDQHYRLMITEVGSGNTRMIAESDFSRLSDFAWSPDSRWLAFTDGLPNQMDVIKIANIENGTIQMATEKWYDSGAPAFSKDGKYLLFTSQRDFSPTYSSTEWNHAYINTYRVYMATLKKETPSPFAPENKDVEAVKKNKDENGKEKEEKNGKNEVTVDIDFDGIANRVVALPIEPSNYYNISSVDNKVYYLRRYQERKNGDGLFVFDLKKKKEEKVGDYFYSLSSNNKKMLIGKAKNWKVVDLPTSEVKMEDPVDLSHMKTTIDYHVEWQQIYDEAWRQMRDFFYVKNMNGRDWQAVYDKYNMLLPYVNHRNDLNYVIGEMIGELNSGHAYVNTGGDKPSADRIKTGLLGATVEATPSGYFRITGILQGAPWSDQMASPLQAPGLNINEGDYILAIDRQSVKDVDNLFKLLVGKADQTVELLINDKPETEGARRILVKTIADESELYYFKWVNENIQKVNEATDGQIGYIHIPDMSSNGLNKFVRFFYPQLNKKGLIVDDRGNGGGNVSPMILERLSREIYRYSLRRNSPVLRPVPNETLHGPKVALIDKY